MRPFPAAALAVFLLAGPALAQATDPADLAFWQSIQGSTNPAEYQAYLDAFPNGRFAAVARLRAGGAGAPGPAAEAAQAPAQGGKPLPLDGTPAAVAPAANAPAAVAAAPPAAAPATPAATVVGDGSAKIVATPAAVRVGQQITLTYQGFPTPKFWDQVIIVPAGTPDLDPARRAADMKIVANSGAMMNHPPEEVSWKVGPFAPGVYEVRWMTSLYNNDDRLEVGARATLTWK